MAGEVFHRAPLLKASFVDRPNRFLVRCRFDTGRMLRAFLPNPGRLWELFFPGAGLYVTKDGGSARKTDRGFRI